MKTGFLIAAAMLAASSNAVALDTSGWTGKDWNDAIISSADPGIDERTPDKAEGVSMGDFVQGSFYGNAANPRDSGNGTLPSQSPGPKVNNPDDPDNPFDGSSWGDYRRDLNPGRSD